MAGRANRSGRRAVATGVLAVVAWGGAVRAAPDRAALARAEDRWAPVLAVDARWPLTLDDGDLAELAAGEAVKRRMRLDGADLAVGAIWTDRPAASLWVAILDDRHDTMVHGLVERQLPGSRPGDKLLYQRLALPWPLADRQWVIRITNNRALWEASGGQVWERTWTLADSQLAARISTANGVWVPVNEGGWLLLPAAGGTLMIYQVRTSMGGIVPDEVATRWALSTLDELMRHVVERSRAVVDHYVGDHAVIVRPDGAAIPPGTLR